MGWTKVKKTMAKKSVLYSIYADLVNAMKNVVDAKYVFLKDRPHFKEGELPMNKFVVVDLPVTIRDYVIGGRKTFLQTNGVFYLFTQSRSNNTLDVNATGDFVDEVVDLFPISGTKVVATNPEVLMTGSDGQGFQVCTISFDLRSKWGAFE